jgi:hypothetical protein
MKPWEIIADNLSKAGWIWGVRRRLVKKALAPGLAISYKYAFSKTRT